MSRIYPTKDVPTRRMATVLDQHFDPSGRTHGIVHDLFSIRPWIAYDRVTEDELRQAAELYWPGGGWEVRSGWLGAGGASPASMGSIGSVAPAGDATVPAAP